MNLATLSVAYIRDRALNSALNLLLLALGMCTIVVLILFSSQFEERLTKDVKGIHLVVGAKGSPLQVILSTIYHVDIPTGNISFAQATKISKHRLVASAIPLALGDAYRGFRIVGTRHTYPANYKAKLSAGRLWEKPFETTIGARVQAETGLEIGDTFYGGHGISGIGETHEDHAYRVVGVFKTTNTVIDRLVMTAVESVWIIHQVDEKAFPPVNAIMGTRPEEREITAMLIRYGSPIAAVTFPRFVNSQPGMQAASPGFEIRRLMNLVGVGVQTLQGFGLLLIATAALSMFIALYNAMQNRRYDLAIMRSLGATRGKLFAQILFEGLILAGLGTVMGIAAGHVVMELAGQLIPQAKAMGLTGALWIREEWYLLALSVMVGIVSATIPAAQVYRTDIAVTLSAK
jgi:putative ABC transport system permease protein